jgi:hypothetical protein
MKNLHLIRARESRLYYTISMSGYNLKLSATPIHQSSEVRPQHIYITNDEEIKEGDWYLTKNGTVLRELFNISRKGKIILTTDQSLDGVQAIDDEFLEWFVKNPSCEEVETLKYADGVLTFVYQIIIPVEELPQETTLEEIAKKVYPDNIVQLSPTFFHNTADVRRHDFIQGYNLHKGELYSEEDMIEFGFSTYCYISELMKVPFNQISENKLHAMYNFEQFKK